MPEPTQQPPQQPAQQHPGDLAKTPPAAPAQDPAPGTALGTALRTSTQRLVRAVDALPDDDWAGWSLLPGWTRADVVAHLALNAEALAACLEGAVLDEAVPMYADDTVRDADIGSLAAAAPGEVRERLLGSCTRLAAALAQVAQVAGTTGSAVLERQVERVPGGRTFLVGEVVEMRLREVEVHHADLDAGYSSADWEPGFSALLLDGMQQRAATGDLVADPDDDPRRWVLGAGGVVVTGPLHALAWWLTGRPAGPEVRSEAGTLPHVPTW